MTLKASLWLTKQLTSPLLWPSCWMRQYSDELAEVQSSFYLFPLVIQPSWTDITDGSERMCQIWFKMLLSTQQTQHLPRIRFGPANKHRSNAKKVSISLMACCASKKTSSPSLSCLPPHLTVGSHKRLQMRGFLSMFREQGVFPLKGRQI